MLVFRYLALDYGLKQVPISGLSPDSEPSAAFIELTKYIKKTILSISILRKCFALGFTLQKKQV